MSRKEQIKLADLVLDGVHLAVLLVDGGDEEVVGDVLEVAAVLQPGAGGRDVVCRALTSHLE